MWHPTLIAEALFAIANIFSSLRLISLFTANSHLGPLQISLGRMLLDILKFLFIYCLVRSLDTSADVTITNKLPAVWSPLATQCIHICSKIQ